VCGIIGYIGSDDPKGILLDALKRLEYRGYDSAGIAVMEGDHIEVFRVEGRLQNLEKKLSERHFKGTMGIGHTRWATHGAPTEINAHPHHVGSITLVHNGIIENYAEHKEALVHMGREIKSETDSEIVAHLFDLETQQGRNLEQAVLNILPRLKGSYAFVVMSDKEPGTLAGIRNGAPLLVGVGEKSSYLASDVQAILNRTNKVIYLEDRQFAICRKDGVSIRTEVGAPIKPVVKVIDWTPDQMDKAGYRHYMLKEIHEQSQAVANTIMGNIDPEHNVIGLAEMTLSTDALRKFDRVLLVACGTARHAGLVGKYYLEKFAGVTADVDYASEFRYRNPILSPNTLLVLISQSGETADTLAALREGKARGVTTLSICNVRDSTLARESDIVLYTDAGPEIGVASTKAFTTQLTVLYMLATQLGFLRGHLTLAQAAELTEDLRKLPLLIDKTLTLESQLEAIALEHHPDTFFFYMARGVNYPVALEGALKLKEISYLLAEGYPAGELKHGPIALVDRRTVIISLAPHDTAYESIKLGPKEELDTLYEKQMSNLQEVKARGGKILSFGTEGDEKLAAQSRLFVGIPRATWALNPIVMSIPMQLLAYYIASFRGTDVDKPRNLAKSVTVE
jgi:glucosamine--fructose-6-phosphate aminotransferase (isomerizing)